MQFPAAQIVVTCPRCRYSNLFNQPHPYHAGYAAQGFLYNEAGDRTLTWSAFDPDYVEVVGRQYPWALSPADKEKLEGRLRPAPDGSRWLFRNPARCTNCGHPISGSIAETIYYLHYDAGVDQDLRAGWGLGLREALAKIRHVVPWSMRDVWLGVVMAVVLVGVAYGLAFLFLALSAEPDPDLWAGVFPTILELLLLIPVWWFTRHKHRAALKALGFKRFAVSVLGIGVAMLVGFYIFNGFYAYLLSLFGREMQGDVTPLLRELSTPWLVVLSVVVVAPVVEETFFRGFVFNGLRSRMDWWWAAAISAALFAAAHLQLWFFLPAFLLGFLFAFVYQKSNSIWPGMILHFLMNGLAATIMLVRM